MSASQVHRAVESAKRSRLINGEKTHINRAVLIRLVENAVAYIYPAQLGPVVRGTPTAHSAPPLSEHIAGGIDRFVWASAEGTVRGTSVKPLHKSAPFAAQKDASFYELLALVDALRVGRARERKIAADLLRHRFSEQIPGGEG